MEAMLKKSKVNIKQSYRCVKESYVAGGINFSSDVVLTSYFTYRAPGGRRWLGFNWCNTETINCRIKLYGSSDR